MDGGVRAVSGTKAEVTENTDDSMDAGGRATQEAKAEKLLFY